MHDVTIKSTENYFELPLDDLRKLIADIVEEEVKKKLTVEYGHEGDREVVYNGEIISTFSIGGE